MDAEREHDPRILNRQRAAVIAAAWVAVIYATVPLVRTLQGWFSARFDKVWITVFVLAAVVVISWLVTTRLRRTGRRIRPADVVWLGAVAIAAGWLTWQLRDRPEEAIHLLEYGILAALIYRAIRPTPTDATVLGAAVLLTTMLGVVDEVIQWITPLRFWDLRDIGLNATAAVLAAIALWRLDPGPWRRPNPDSIRQILRLSTILIVGLALCLANTPDRVAWYSAHIPGLGFLAHPANEMAEYGHQHVIPNLGEFKSRFDLSELEEEDRQRGAEVAEIIHRYPDGSHRRFILGHQGFEDPLLYEVRIHIFSRDHNASLARSDAPGSAEETDHFTRAFRENRILEDFFGNTLRHSVFALNEGQRRLLETSQDPDQHFVSKVGSHIITTWSERDLRRVLLMTAAIMVALSILLGIRSRRREDA